MKRFLGILICVFAFSSCDDGDLVVDTIDFVDAATSECSNNNLIFKIKESESLILNIPKETFVNNPTPPNEPTELTIIPANKEVVYNFYNGKVATENICGIIDLPGISINKQWNAASGVIQITTTAIKSLDEANNSTRITGYNNSIVFKNITFKKEDGTTQFYKTFPFGDYKKTVASLPFGFSGLLDICSNNGQVYDYSESESMTLDNIDPLLIVNVVTPIDAPRTGVIGADKNKLAYRLFTNGILRPEYFCQTNTPILPTVSEEWLGTEGTVEVTTTTSGPDTFKHTIVLKDVTLEKDDSNFQLGNNYKYGELTTRKQK